MRAPSIKIIMPAYNAAGTLRDTYREIPQQFRTDVILVDDQSTDRTVAVAKKIGIKVFLHSHNLGYGGNQKTGYWEAMKRHPNVIVMLHPDYQYDARRIHELITPILMGEYDVMFGSRIKKRRSALAGGMPRYKYVLNRLVGTIENIILGVNFSEHFSGFRAYSSQVLEAVPFQRFSNDFVFDQQMMVSALSYGFRVGEIEIPTRYHSKASSIGFTKGIRFILETFWLLFIFKLHEAKMIRSRLFQ